MAVVKVIEVIAESPDGWEKAAQLGVAEASKTVRNIKAAYVHEMQAKVQGDKIATYRVNLKISFLVE